MGFKAGDLIEGNNDIYKATNRNMRLAVVLREDGVMMKIKVLKHKNKDEEDKEFSVANDSDRFNLVKGNAIRNKNHLKNGDIVTLRNGERLIVYGFEYLCDLSNENKNSLVCFDEINMDLTKKFNKDEDIIKVERPIEYIEMYNRERENIIKKMTVAQICEELGYDVEIVKEDE